MMRVLVTGGGGFLGSRVVELLLGRGDAVRFLARGRYPALEARGAEGYQIDLSAPVGLDDALTGVDAVVHVAAKAGYWGPIADYRAINVDGTRNLIDAMRRAGVPRLVYTSTPSVIGYSHDVAGISEAPYPDHWESPYATTKAEAERLVLAANGDGLATVSLRPHLIIGPGDNNLLPKVLARARAGTLVQVGDGTNRVDLTDVDNAAWAHLDALDALTSPHAACAGRAYFISNDEPVVLWGWVNAFLSEVGVPPVTRRIPFGLALALGGLAEAAYRWLPLRGEPRMTRFLASALARTHWYDMGPARRDFGYRIRVPLAESTQRTAAAFRA